MDKIEVVDNFLPERYFLEIQSLFENQYVNWFHSPSTTTDNLEIPGVIDSQMFYHNILFNKDKSVLYNIFHPFHYFIESIAKYKVNEMHRIRANFTFPIPGFTQENFNTPHCDANTNLISALYYVNNSDGDTYFFDKFKGDDVKDLNILKKVSPKENRIIFFPSNQYHAGSNPIDNNKRIVINFMFSSDVAMSNEKLVGVV